MAMSCSGILMTRSINALTFAGYNANTCRIIHHQRVVFTGAPRITNVEPKEERSPNNW